MFYAKLYAVTASVFLVIDLVWLGVVAKGFYRNQLGHLLRPDPQLPAAVAFYLLFVAGLLVFAVVPALDRGSLSKALVLGGFFGLVAYATYDLTNLALTKDFPGVVAAVDMVWGAVLAATVSAISYEIGRRLI